MRNRDPVVVYLFRRASPGDAGMLLYHVVLNIKGDVAIE
jgi:hypothetical protein